MKATKNQLLLIFLQDSEPMTRMMLRSRWQKKFGEQPDFKFLYPSLTELIDLDVILEFDIEDSGAIEWGSATHKEYGEIEFTDMNSYSGLDELLSLSSGAPAYVMENAAALTKEAADLGMGDALKKLKAMPIDSTAWTGRSRGFAFNEQTKKQMVTLLDQSIDSLSQSNLRNHEISQGLGLLKAVRILAETPDPPKEDIWSLLNKGAVIATIAGFFVPIIALLNK
ncbi:MAG TPA: hypothetical protein VJM08_03530 [Anaerolineales bacterium]|nr:hypothetical protein [Anaerolineales bacterium]